MRVAGLTLGRHCRRATRRLGLRRVPSLGAIDLRPPDSVLARRAAALARSISSAFLVNHAERTYAFGMALSYTLERRPDRELLYVASMLHDLGLTDAHPGPAPFELRGADAAHAFCLAEGCDPERAARVHEAIALHTSLEAASGAPEVALVHFGAGLDVIGYRADDVGRETIEQVVSLWPRLGLKAHICERLAREAAATPSSPLGVQWRLGFASRIAHAPFSE